MAHRTAAQQYSTRLADALTFPCKEPLRLLAAAVILRWIDDGATDEIDTQWAQHADVPPSWLAEVAHV